MKKILLYMFLLYISNTIAQDNSMDNGPGILISNYVNKTVLFPGDRITYVIEIACDADVDILVDDLAEDELVLTGLELVNANYQQENTDNGTRYRFSYSLSTYETGDASLKIDELRVRYYFKRPGQRIEDVASVGEVTISGVDLTTRSTLAGDFENLQLRDLHSPVKVSSWLDWAGVLGSVLILVSIFPVGSSLFAYLQNRRLENQAQQAKESTVVSTSIFDDLRNINANDIPLRRQGFYQLESIIRDYIGDATGLAAGALTSDDLSQNKKMTDLNLSVEELIEVLNLCEYARFGRNENLPVAEQFTQGIQLTEKLVTGS